MYLYMYIYIIHRLTYLCGSLHPRVLISPCSSHGRQRERKRVYIYIYIYHIDSRTWAGHYTLGC